MKNELYASLELQISMARDYSEWLKQETKRNNELLNAHSTALRHLNSLMVQSPSEEENVDSGRGGGLPDGLKWEDAPKWAKYLAKGRYKEETNILWCNEDFYLYPKFLSQYSFHSGYKYINLNDLEIIATRPKEV